MVARDDVETWIRTHRVALLTGWAAIGAVALGWLMIWGPRVYYVRGIAPWPRGWIALFFLSLWGWVALRFIFLWIWAWVVMAGAPVFLFLPIRFYLDAWWLLPLLIAVVVLSALSVVTVVTLHLRRRRRAAG